MSVSPGACDKDGPGEINVPLAAAARLVPATSSWDRDGIAVVPRAHALKCWRRA